MGRLSVTAGHPAGIPLRLHLSWLLLAGWIVWVAAGLAQPMALKLLLIFFLMVLCVLLHELAHALAGRAVGLHVREIVLYPFGGLSTFDDLPAGEPRAALVFLAGPAMNLAAAGLFWLAGARGTVPNLAAPEAGAPVLTWLAWSNLTLGLFNLVPILPLDGGQIVKNLLSRRLGELRASRILGGVGQTGGIVLLAWGLAGRPWLVLAGLLVLAGATSELRRIHPLLLAETQRVRDVMRTGIVSVEADTTVGRLRDISRARPSADFVLVEHGVPTAYLPAARLWLAGENVPAASAGGLATPLGRAVDPDDPLGEATARLESEHAAAAPVIDRHGRLRGVLLEAGARRSLSLLRALSTRDAPRGRPGPGEGTTSPREGGDVEQEDSGREPC